jgi:deazaflavin-dependent oxidoreductase (nitroreductase family)
MRSTKGDNVPGMVTFFNRVVTWLARRGFPLGPNMLLTVRGRKSGIPHTTPVAIIEVDDRRWIQSPFGEVQWTRNLRAAGEATLSKGGHKEHITATALSRDEAEAFYGDILRRSVDASIVTRFAGRFLGLTELVKDPAAAAATHAVFEIHHPA